MFSNIKTLLRTCDCSFGDHSLTELTRGLDVSGLQLAGENPVLLWIALY